MPKTSASDRMKRTNSSTTRASVNQVGAASEAAEEKAMSSNSAPVVSGTAGVVISFAIEVMIVERIWDVWDEEVVLDVVGD